MSLRSWIITTVFPNTAAAYGIRDAERGFPTENDWVEIPLYDTDEDGENPDTTATGPAGEARGGSK